MRTRKAKDGEKIYLIKVILKRFSDRVKASKVSPYRVLAIPEGLTLYRLAEAIVYSFDFWFDHCFGFYDNINRWLDPDEGYELFADIGEESEFKGVEKTKVNKVFDKIGKKMLFLFDYGDNWEFIVELIGVESPKEGEKYPFVLEFVGAAPTQYSESVDL
ncbi:MAG: plasmid pRiA4b ORF-3 family protein [Candidatus Dadabacteria bacterium]|nr:plasmid pRiA4b ORF-3 family protein [Candidatus Dadabacteria bacterium]